MEEHDLIVKANRGDLNAFNEIVLAYQDRVYNQAYRILGDPHSAEDITQEAFLNAYLKLNTYRGGSFKSWLLRIATNLCFDLLRREKVRPSVALEPLDDYGDEIESPIWLVDPAASPAELTERSALREDLQDSLDRLSPEYRLAVVLVDIQELDYVEAAQVMGVSLGTLKSRLVRGRLKMRELLKKREARTIYSGPNRDGSSAGRSASTLKDRQDGLPGRVLTCCA